GTWQQNLNAVLGRNRQQLLDLFIRGRGGGGSAWRHRHADIEEHLFQSCRGQPNQHPGGLAALILEGMRRAARHVCEHASLGGQPFASNRKGNLAIEDVETFFFPAVDVQRWPAAWRNEGFKQSVFAAGILAGGQKAVNVTNDGNRAAFGGRS